MISFDNTEIAFRNKTNADLNRAYWLFKLIGNNSLVKIGNALMRFSLKLQLPIKGIIKHTTFKQFCGGENINECAKTIALLAKYSIGTILDYSVEGKEEENDLDKTMNEIIATIHKAKGNAAIPFCVFKTTGIASNHILEKVNKKEILAPSEKEKFIQIKHRVNKICKTAFDNEVPLFIDAEESWRQNTIDELATEMMEIYNKQKPIVYNTLQMYRTDRIDFLKQVLSKAGEKNYFLGLKLVRGAYLEKENNRAEEFRELSPIHQSKADTDNSYNEALKICIENIYRIAICAGTHNEKSSLYLSQLMEEKNIQKNHSHIYFSQLYGMGDHISYNLANGGYNVVKYVPYGPVEEVLPYLVRRAEENTSIAGQTGRELGLIIKEKKRRKLK